MHRIEIKDFFAIQQARIDIEKIVLLIGAQASGKSTISKLIYFFKSLRQDFLSIVYRRVADSALTKIDTTVLREEFWFEIRRKFIRYFGSTRHLSDFEIKYYYADNKFFTFNLCPDRNLKVEANPLFFDLMFKSELLELMKQSIGVRATKDTLYGQIEFAEKLKQIEQKINEIFEDNRVPRFIPASRNLTVTFPDQLKLLFFGTLSGDINFLEREQSTKFDQDNDSKLSSMSIDLYLMSEFMKHVERIKERFKNQDFASLIAASSGSNVDAHWPRVITLAHDKVRRVLRADYRLDQFGEKLYYADNKYVDLNDASSGQQEAIRILQDICLILTDRTNTFRVLEEPEAHLYPLAQKALLELLAIMLNNTESQVVITTHSPYILSVFNNLLYAHYVAGLKKSVQAANVAKFVPQDCWLNPQSFCAYALENGISQSIMDTGTGMIAQNFLDEISEELGEEFNSIYSIHAEMLR